MKIAVSEDYGLELREVFCSVTFVSADKEQFSICMRDSGYEFSYAGKHYEAKNGILREFPVSVVCTDPRVDGSL